MDFETFYKEISAKVEKEYTGQDYARLTASICFDYMKKLKAKLCIYDAAVYDLYTTIELLSESSAEKLYVDHKEAIDLCMQDTAVTINLSKGE